MAEQPAFVRAQMAFAAHIRDPARTPRPADVEERRMKIYRELFYNNVEGFVASGFPVLRSLYVDPDWHRLVRDFFAHHRCKTPYFLEIAQEFLAFLEQEYPGAPNDPPFLLELAHYEWVELALQTEDETTPLQGVDPNGDLVHGVAVVSSLAWPLSYRFPVHRIRRDFQPSEPPAEPTHLLVLRDRTDRIRFNEINGVTARLLTLLQENRQETGAMLLARLAEEMRHPEPKAVVAAGANILEDLRRQGVILGSRNAQGVGETSE